jgi:peptidoglycan/LPS O-acetylase OafA/YrhL
MWNTLRGFMLDQESPASMDEAIKRRQTGNGSRFQELDVLRGLAALAVLLFHYLTRYDQIYTPRGDVPFGFEDGSYGVDLFFVISGFVIFMTLSRCKTASDFLVSRFSRLYPAYWAAVLLTYALGSLWPLPGSHYSAAQVLANLTMVQGFALVPSIDGVYWSLSVELCFYAIMLALFLSGWLANTVRLSIIWLAAAAATSLLSDIGIDVPWRIQQVFALGYAELFVAGINFYEIYRKGPSASRVALLVCCLAVHLIDHGVGSAERVLVILGLVAIAVSGRVRFVCLAPLLWLGTISYSLYLTHQMIGYAVIRWLSESKVPSVIAIPITIAIALALASVMTYFIERPAMRAIRSRRKPLAVAVTSSLRG